MILVSKYHARKVTVDGMTFDSKKEYQRWLELKTLERAKVIKNLRRQVPFELLPRVPGRFPRPVKYIADFTYRENGEEVVEDVKGYRTDVYKLKKRLMWVVHGIDIREI